MVFEERTTMAKKMSTERRQPGHAPFDADDIEGFFLEEAGHGQTFSCGEHGQLIQNEPLWLRCIKGGVTISA